MVKRSLLQIYYVTAIVNLKDVCIDSLCDESVNVMVLWKLTNGYIVNVPNQIAYSYGMYLTQNGLVIREACGFTLLIALYPKSRVFLINASYTMICTCACTSPGN